MKRIPNQHILATLVAPLLLSGSLLQGATYFSENFDTTTTAGLTNAGWDINHNEFALEDGSDFVLAKFPYADADYVSTVWPVVDPGNAGVPGTSFYFIDATTTNALVTPPDEHGLATSVASGGYLISDSDYAGGSDNIGSKSEFWATTPSFGTIGAAEVWYHADAAIDANNNGECLVTLDVSVDGGTTWLQAWAQAEPQRPIKAYNFNLSTDPTYEGGDPIGGYPVLGSYSQTKTWSGIHGRWHVKLPAAAANKASVKVRIRYIEPADAWWIALDNVVVDNNPPPQGSQVVLSETFDNGIPATWKNLSSPQKWGTSPLTNSDGTLQMTTTPGDPATQINVDLLGELAMARLAGFTIAPTAVNNWAVTNFVDFADQPSYHPDAPIDGYFMMMMAGGKYAMWQAPSNYSVANLDTPTLDLTGKTEVFLDYDSEWLNRIYTSDLPTTNSQVFLAQVSVDGGTTFSNVFNYQAGLGNIGEASYFMHHYIPVPQAAGKSSVVFRFQATGLDTGNPSDPEDPNSGTRHMGFWVIDNVRVTANAPAVMPSISNITTSGGNVTVTWPGGAGIRLQKTTTLTNPLSWADIASTLGNSTYSEPLTATPTYYRLYRP